MPTSPVRPNDLIVKVDDEDIRRRLGPFVKELPKVLGEVVLMRTVNRSGNIAKTAVIRELSKIAGSKQRDVRQNVLVERATIRNLEYVLSVKEEWISGLFHVMTASDDKVCLLCMDAARRGPYTADQLEIEFPNPHGGGLIHPNCRCSREPVEAVIEATMGETGEVARIATDAVERNMERIFMAEYEFAISKLKQEHKL